MAGPFTLQIIQASDLEAANTALSRMPQFAAIVDKLSGQYANTLKIVAGDEWIQGPFYAAEGDPAVTPALRAALTKAGVAGAATASAASTRVSVAFEDLIGVQVASFGNHEFDGGTGPINDALGVANFPILSANYDFSKDTNLRTRVTADGQEASTIKGRIAGSAVVTINGEKIGIVGATTQVLASDSSPGLVTSKTGPAVDDMPALARILQPYIDALTAQGITKIVLSTHLQQYQNEQALIPLLRGVDINVSGGSHALFQNPGVPIREGDVAVQPYPVILKGADGNPVLEVNTQNEYGYVSRLVATFDANGVIIPGSVDPSVSQNYVTTDATVAALYGSADPYAAGSIGAAAKALIAPLGTVISSKDGNIQGYAAVFLAGDRVTVRQQESNLADLSADANLFVARQVDPTAVVSIKNGGGIRDVIGAYSTDAAARPIPTAANPLANKPAGAVSQLDIENSLRFNNNLSLATVTAQQLKQIMEFGASLVDPAATPGGFVQVGGLRVSYDLSQTAQAIDVRGAPVTVGQRVRTLAITNDDGSIRDVIVANGQVVGDGSRPIRLVTLDFISTSTQGAGTVGGDANPLAAYATNVVALTGNAALGAGLSTFAAPGTEQDALAEYFKTRYGVQGAPYLNRETPAAQDQRIQVLSLRSDGVLDPATSGAAELVGGASALGARFIAAALGGTGLLVKGAASAVPGRATIAQFEGGATSVSLLPTGYKGAALAGAGTLFGQGSDYLLTATQAGGTLVAQGTGGATLVAAQAGSVLFGGAGSTTLVGGDGDDTLVGGAGAQTIYTGAGRNLVGLGGGSSVVVAEGQDTILAGGGAALVQTAGAATVFGGSGGLTFVGGSGQSVVVAGSGSATVFGGTGGGLLAGGRAGGNVLVAGQGATTLFGGGNGDTLYAAGPAADTLIAASSGNATLVGAGSTGANTYFAGGGANLIGGGAGNETFFAGRGQATVIGGAGADVFSFNNGLAGGAVVITDFNQAAGDRLAIVGYAGGAASALATAQSAGGSTTLSLTDGTRITLQGVTGLTGSAFV